MVVSANRSQAGLLVLIVGVLASVTAFETINRMQRQQRLAVFELHAQYRFQRVARVLHDIEQQTAALAAYLRRPEQATAAGFASICQALHRQSETGVSLHWAPRLDAKPAGDGAPPAAQYPLLLNCPQVTGDPQFQPDLVTDPVLREVLIAARDSALPQASSPRPLAWRRTPRTVLMQPVFHGPNRTLDDRRLHIAGIAAAGIDLPLLLGRVMQRDRQAAAVLYSQVIDAATEGEPALYRDDGWPPAIRADDPRQQRTLRFGNRQWTMVSTPRVPPSRYAWTGPAWQALLAGLTLTALALLLLRLHAGRRQRALSRSQETAQALASERRFSAAILDASSNGSLVLDGKWLIIQANAAVYHIFGYPAGSLIGKPASDLIPGIGPGLHGTGSMEVRGVTSEGFPLDLQLRYSERESTDDYFVVLIVNDVTEQRVVESSVRDQRNLMQAILETMNEGLVLVDQRRRPQLVNGAARAMLGQAFRLPEPSDEPNRDGFLDRVSGTALSNRALPLNRALCGETIEFQELILRNAQHPHGLRLEVSAKPVQRGNFTAAMMVLSDVTERMLAQEKLAHYARRLESNNRELDQFTRAASHDLQEPLRKIERFGSLLWELNQQILDEQSLGYLDRMISAATRMSDMIDSLLTLSRVNSRKQSLEPCNLNRIAVRALENLQLRIGDTDARIEIGTLPEIAADPIQMEQLFTNIIGNATKYVQAGDQPWVEVSARQDPETGDWIIAFRDHGIGFPADKAVQLFDVFTRLVRREEYPGSGIGLSICKRVVERHGGQIWAESAAGEGATFFVRLPAVQPDDQPTAAVTT